MPDDGFQKCASRVASFAFTSIFVACLSTLGCGGQAGAEAQPGDGPVFRSSEALSGCSTKNADAAPGDHLITVTSGGIERSAVIHVPPALGDKKDAMLVLNFHSYNGTPANQAARSLMNAVSDARGILVAYPAGVGNSWNAGQCCGEAWLQQIDDVQFTRDLIDAITARYCVHPGRIFATGLSNGGLMAYRLGCELADKISAIAPVAAVLHTNGLECEPSKPVSVIHFHGTGDVIIPYAGGVWTPPFPVPGSLDFISAADTIATWVALDQCSGAAQQVFENGAATCSAWSSCKQKTAVEFCSIDGAGHTWPGGGPLPPLFGSTSMDISASEVMVDFFEAHGR